ncbi:AAEL006266-PA [Aedes aegypti]|uniref:AAEL006266-PA n=1 Tax=Aedes aegypti TaxID=7159 RepID=Q176T6_AEDAE|nr:AAEL006266-PA [Aedes aegypti]
MFLTTEHSTNQPTHGLCRAHTLQRSVSADNQYEADREGSNEIIPPPRYVEFLKAERDEAVSETILPPRYIEVRKGRIILESQKLSDTDTKTDGKDSFSRFAKSKLALGSPTIPDPPGGYERPMIRSQPQSPIHERSKTDSIGTNCSSRSEPCKNTFRCAF